MADYKKVLAIDGGGIRGIIAATFLAELEERVGEPIANIFDLIVGTSTGGILALGLAMRDGNGEPCYSAKEGAGFYQLSGPEIFKKPLFACVREYFQETYSTDKMQHVLKKYYGEAILGSLVRPHVLITSYDLKNRKPRFFKSSRQKDTAFKLWEVASATAAAPSYFEPFPEKDAQNGIVGLIDGGVIANNPAMCAYAEAIDNGPQPILLISVGTGYSIKPIEYDEAKDWGKLEWLRPILGIVFDGMGAAVDYQLDQILNSETECNYFRFQVPLNAANEDLDNVKPKNLGELVDYGKRMIEEADHSGQLDDIVQRLKPSKV